MIGVSVDPVLFSALVLALATLTQLADGSCELSESWSGQWFQSGIPHPILIQNNKIDTKGVCYERSNDKFLFLDSCLVINERHKNVLQYKESYFCEEKDGLEKLCNGIPGDAQLYTIFRIGAAREECPFRGAPFTFSYNRGHGECRDPISHVDTCTSSAKLLFRYEACPNVLKTESTSEEMECQGSWREGSYHYLVAKLHQRQSASHEDSLRCFMFEKMKSDGNGGHVGFRVAQSGDATCTGITSPTEGAKTFTLTKVEHGGIKCKYPNWVTNHRWQTLDGRLSLRMHHKNSTLVVEAEEGGKLRPTKESNGEGLDLFPDAAQFSCQSRLDISEKQVAVFAHQLQDCKSEGVCLRFYKRDNHIVEVEVEKDISNECGRGKSNGGKVVTLVSAKVPPHRCPHGGKYKAKNERCSAGHPTLHIGCNDPSTMEFSSPCLPQQQPASYLCHGSWKENGVGFLLASPLSVSSTSARRLCFVYAERSDGLHVSASNNSCQTNFGPEVQGNFAFNLSHYGQCGRLATGNGGKFKPQQFLLIPFSILYFFAFL